MKDVPLRSFTSAHGIWLQQNFQLKQQKAEVGKAKLPHQEAIKTSSPTWKSHMGEYGWTLKMCTKAQLQEKRGNSRKKRDLLPPLQTSVIQGATAAYNYLNVTSQISTPPHSPFSCTTLLSKLHPDTNTARPPRDHCAAKMGALQSEGERQFNGMKTCF